MIFSIRDIFLTEILFFISAGNEVLLANTPLPHAFCLRCIGKGLNFGPVVSQGLAVADAGGLGDSLGL